MDKWKDKDKMIVNEKIVQMNMEEYDKLFHFEKEKYEKFCKDTVLINQHLNDDPKYFEINIFDLKSSYSDEDK